MQEISAGGRQIREIPFAELASLDREPVGAYVFACLRCAARTETNETASLCQFCGAPLVIDPNASQQPAPEGVLPFARDRGGAGVHLDKWTSSRWFAPTALKKVTTAESAKSTYIPHWTYDSRTVSVYTGSRGEYYYVTESYVENGERKTRQVRHTRWYPARGRVARNFDDVLVPASTLAPTPVLDSLPPWPLPDSVPYQPQYLAGHFALRYDVEPESGFDEAKRRMAPVIADDRRNDIGGDTRQLDSVDTRHDSVTFKLTLLPVWVATYVYAGRNWQIFINGRTGEVHGERPWSKVEIAVAVVLALIGIAAIVYFFSLDGGGSRP